MIPILFEQDETVFETNSICRLRDCPRCEVTEERNGIYECEFDYPIDGVNFEEIKVGRIIAVMHDDNRDIQPFDIVSHTKDIGGLATFRAVHISYRLTGITATLKNITTIGGALTGFSSGTPSNPFTFSTDMDTSVSGSMGCADGTPRTVREMMGGVEGSFIDTWGGEFRFDKFDVQILSARGASRDFTIRYGVNMTEYSDEVDISELYTAVIPFWYQEEVGAVVGDMVDSGYQLNGRTVCIPMDLSDQYETQPTKAQLQSMAASKISSQKPYNPGRTIRVNFIQLSDSPDYTVFSELEQCLLCDYINIRFPAYGVDDSYKVVKTVYDVLTERYIEMELGNLSTSLAEALGVSEGSESGGRSTRFQHGTITGQNISSHDYADFTVTFDVAFPAAPTVVAGLQSSSTGYGVGSVSVGVHTITATGFKARVFNNDSTTRSPNIEWIAIY